MWVLAIHVKDSLQGEIQDRRQKKKKLRDLEYI